MPGSLPEESRYAAGSHLYVEPFVLLGHRHRADARPTRLGDYAVIRSHSVIYGDVEIGDRFKCGHSVVIRAETEIGNCCVVGGRTTPAPEPPTSCARTSVPEPPTSSPGTP